MFEEIFRMASEGAFCVFTRDFDANVNVGLVESGEAEVLFRDDTLMVMVNGEAPHAVGFALRMDDLEQLLKAAKSGGFDRVNLK